MSFVERVAKDGSPDFVPADKRIATFDNDGTLWAEQPLYFQLFFAIDRVKALAPQHPEWKDKEPFASLLGLDVVLPPKGDAAKRDRALRKSIEDPKVALAGTRVSADPKSPYIKNNLELLEKSYRNGKAVN